MGKLIHDSCAAVEIDDRVLAHLQQVIGSKLRRGEKFFLNWPTGTGADSTRTAIWMHSSMSLRFEYDSASSHDLNRAWLEALILRANSAAGLSPVPEPGPAQDDAPARASAGALSAV